MKLKIPGETGRIKGKPVDGVEDLGRGVKLGAEIDSYLTHRSEGRASPIPSVGQVLWKGL